MKKTFVLSHPKIKVARLFDAAKHEAKKYIKREQKKTLPEGADYWDFDCKYGRNQDEAHVIHVSQINKSIEEAEKEELGSFYLEIIAKPAVRTKKESPDA